MFDEPTPTQAMFREPISIQAVVLKYPRRFREPEGGRVDYETQSTKVFLTSRFTRDGQLHYSGATRYISR